MKKQTKNVTNKKENEIETRGEEEQEGDGREGEK